jgi:hypothetical protein
LRSKFPRGILNSLLALFSTMDTGAYALVILRFPEPIDAVTEVAEQPVEVRQSAQQYKRGDGSADVDRRDEQLYRSGAAVADGVLLCVHAASPKQQKNL